jgi:23S rRNA (adenine2503-C2)-methyltransferase
MIACGLGATGDALGRRAQGVELPADAPDARGAVTPAQRVELTDLELPALEAAMAGLDAEPFHARQIFGWLYRRGATDFAEMTDLSRALRASLPGHFTIGTPVVVRRDVSSDGTAKLLLRLRDEQLIESVYIPDTPKQTFCISTQVGCAMRCAFCLTGKMGIVRDLSPGEIAGQVLVLAREFSLLAKPFNIVLMGMGEPLHNYDNTMAALRILAAAPGFAVPARRITLSTVGVLPALERLATEPFMPNLAISLHATTEEMRDQLVPVNRKYGLADLIEACRRFPVKSRERITFEYVLLDGVNDTAADARRLVKLLAGVPAKVNLLPLNEAAGIPFTRPPDQRVDAFARILAERGVRVSVRKSRGRDIRAACGQLLVDGTRRSAGQELAGLL